MKTSLTNKKASLKKNYITNVILHTPFFRTNNKLRSESLEFSDANLRFLKIMNIGI